VSQLFLSDQITASIQSDNQSSSESNSQSRVHIISLLYIESNSHVVVLTLGSVHFLYSSKFVIQSLSKSQFIGKIYFIKFSFGNWIFV
jgi:hypothetical protein